MQLKEKNDNNFKSQASEIWKVFVSYFTQNFDFKHLLSFLLIRIGFPVFLCLKLLVSGLEAPLRVPKIAFSAWCECEPPSRLNLPARFEQTGLDVVFSPKVDAVGAKSGGY